MVPSVSQGVCTEGGDSCGEGVSKMSPEDFENLPMEWFLPALTPPKKP